MKKNIFNYVKLILSVLLLSLPASAIETTSKIAVIDFARITNEAKSYKSLAESVKEKGQVVESELKKVITELKNLKEGVLKKQGFVDEQGFAELIEEYNKDYIKKTTSFNKRKLQIKSSYNESTDYINKEIKNIVKKISEQKKLDIVIQKGLLAFSKTNLDITDEIILNLDKKIKTMSIDEK